VPEEYVKRNYERDAYPDPTRYYVKDFPGYAAIYPEVEIILPKYSRPVYTTKNTTPENFRVHLCELCRTAFDTEDELSQHVSTSH
jgi:Glu-tRNA(Gln) amidotransferase subunit E-like FAD-binding protein